MIRFLKPCDECGGTGNEMGEFFDCPSCVGGWLPDDETVEAAADAAHCEAYPGPVIRGDDRWETFKAITRAALVAAARYQSERVEA